MINLSFDQAPFLEATLTRVLSQPYPNRDDTVFSGDAIYGSVGILHPSELRLAARVSERDRDHAHTLNNRCARSAANVVAWIDPDAPLPSESLLTQYPETGSR